MALGGSAACLSAAPAGAYTQYYCGYLIPSTSGYSCTSSAAYLSYNQASYGGAGNIAILRSWLNPDAQRTGYNTTIVKACRDSLSRFNQGNVGQWDNGADHTITGYVDDSPNHTCPA
jgi:hypothetical protein